MHSSDTLHRLFKRQASETPNVPAVVDGSTTYTYGELDRLTDGLAGYLQAQGVHFDTPVGIFMETCAEYTLPYIAALKAGGAYMPLDLAYPRTLLEKILKEAEPRVVVTKSAYADRLDFDHSARVLCIDSNDAWRSGRYDPEAIADQTPDHLAFVAYSSGTTGEPKGIQDPHRGAVHSYFRRYEISDYRVGDRVACNIFFVWEVMRPLLRGGTSCVIPDDIIYDPKPLVDYLAENRITEVLMTPSLLETVLNFVDGDQIRAGLADLRVLWLNGEVVTVNLRDRALSVLPESTRLLNTYSISECHDVASLDLRKMAETGSEFCPVGFPNKDVDARLFDENLRPVEGDKGELLIGGPCLARGYLKKPALTAERFVTIQGHRYYRTGDMARFLDDGRIEILGRCDYMVKIRGYSINMGAVESALEQVPEVKSCAVIAEGEEGTDKRLVAYVVPDGAVELGIDPETGVSPRLREALAKDLPNYAIPSIFIAMEAIPLNPVTGKLNRKALPAPPTKRAQDFDLPEVPPHASPEQLKGIMLDLWGRMLGVSQGTMDGDADFFDFGGHSLLAVELAVAIEKVFGEKILAKDIYAHPTPAALTEYLKNPRKETEEPGFVEDARLDPDVLPDETAFKGPLSDARSVLITGATGFLGAFLLREILDRTREDVIVYALVRAGKEAGPDARIRDNLAYYGLWEAHFEGRIKGVAGDLTRDRLGLSEAAWDRLGREVNLIFHCASLVNYVYPYEAIKPHTVDGTEGVIRLAFTGPTKPLYYVSTNGVFPETGDGPFREDDPIEPYADHLSSGYCQAKWTAEKLVWDAVSRGLPAAVFRPGNIGHHSRSGRANPHDFQLMLLEACARIRSAPAVEDWYFEMTPVDLLTRTIAGVAEHPNGYVGRPFNIISKDRASGRSLFQRMRERGMVADIVPFEKWRERLGEFAEKTGDRSLTLMAQSLEDVIPYLTDTARYDCSRFEKTVAELGIDPPAVDTAYFDKLLERIRE